MNLLLSCLLASAAHAQDLPVPVYMEGARLEIDAATADVEGWLAAAERRGDVDERMCLRSKLAPLLSYATVASDAARASTAHVAAGDSTAVALDVRQVSAAVERARGTHEKAKACLVDASPSLSTFEDPELWRILLPMPEEEIAMGCSTPC